jgi:hypothetical protein
LTNTERQVSVKEAESRRSFFLPKFRHVRWTWRRWALLCVAVVPFADQFFLPTSRWDDSSSQGILFLILAFRAVAEAEPPPFVVVAGACMASLMTAISHGIVHEVSPIWTPLGLALIVFLLLTWRRGRKDAPPDSTRQ